MNLGETKDKGLQIFLFQTKLINGLGRGEGIVAGVAGQAIAIPAHSGGADHAFHGQIVHGIQADEIGDGFFIAFFCGQQFAFGRKINTVGAGMNRRGTADGHMNLFDPDSPQILDAVAAGGAADNRVFNY